MIKSSTKNTLLISALFVLAVLLLGSCSIERRLAYEYYRQRQSNAIMIIPADFVYKRNLKAWEIEGAEEMDDFTLDSALYSNSKFVQYISDSIFLEAYMNSLIDGLRKKGVKVYLQPDADLFLEETRTKHIVNVAQLLLEENVDLLFDPQQDMEYRFMGDFYLNTVVFSAWYEISGVNEHDPKTAVAFADLTLSDRFDGRMRYYPFTGNMVYTYSVDSISVDDVYYLADAAGQEHSGYIFDYLMNRYIDQNIPPGKPRTVYYRYDFNTRMLKQASDERFEFIE